MTFLLACGEIVAGGGAADGWYAHGQAGGFIGADGSDLDLIVVSLFRGGGGASQAGLRGVLLPQKKAESPRFGRSAGPAASATGAAAYMADRRATSIGVFAKQPTPPPVGCADALEGEAELPRRQARISMRTDGLRHAAVHAKK